MKVKPDGNECPRLCVAEADPGGEVQVKRTGCSNAVRVRADMVTSVIFYSAVRYQTHPLEHKGKQQIKENWVLTECHALKTLHTEQDKNIQKTSHACN